MRAHDWAATPLGPPEFWPQSLKTAAEMILAAPFASVLLWGPDLVVAAYNEGYRTILGDKPEALGRPVLEVWAEERDLLGPQLARVVNGETLSFKELPMSLKRGFESDESWFDYGYGPVRDETGRVAGLVVTISEITHLTARAEKAREDEAREAFMLRLSDTLRPLADSDAIQYEACRLLAERLGVDRAFYLEADEAAGVGRVVRDFTRNGAPSLVGTHRLADFNWSIAMLSRGESYAIADTQSSALVPEAERPASATLQLIACLAVPLVKNELLVGALGVTAGRPREWSAAEVELAREVGERIWAAAEQARAEVAERESEARYRTLFEAIDSGFCIFEVIFDDDGRATDYRFVETNPAFELQSGLVNVVGRRIREFAPDLEEVWFERYGCVALTGEPFRVEDRAEPLGRWFDINAFRVGAPEQRRVAVLFNDMSARRNAEAELRESEERLRALNADLERQVIDRTRERGRTWSITPDMLSVLDVATGVFDRVNPAWTATLGWSADELEGSIFADFVHPDDLAASYEGLAVLKRGDPLLFFENRYRNKAGAYRWLRWTAVPEGGKLYSTTRDVTEEKAQAATLAERTAERDRVWRNSLDILATSDAEGIIRSVNPAWTHILGHTEAETVGRGFRDFVLKEDADPTQAAVDAAVAGADVKGFENRYWHKDGSWRRIVWRTSTEGGLIYGYGRDITDEREREAELTQAQEALRQSQKMEAMGSLTGGVAHDFNNLLTPIVGALDMLQRKGMGGEREQRLISGAAQSADRAKTLVQRLLAFARRQPLQPTAVDVAKLVHGMADLLASTSGPQIRVVVEAAGDVPAASADLNQLEMALLNLGVNARDAMPDGGTLRVTASAERVQGGHRSKLKAGEYIRLSVADTGRGMDEATLARAVEPFFSTKGVGKGTGLGLSMVHGLASQLGGALTIDSRPGVGTNVELWLPRSVAVTETVETAPELAASMSSLGKALLVDDEELVRISTADMLAEMGYAVVEAASGEDALRLVEGGLQPDLLVTDHLMPGMNGTELVGLLRAKWPSLQVLVVSGYAETDGLPPDLPRLTKPFRSADLTASLAELTATNA